MSRILFPIVFCTLFLNGYGQLLQKSGSNSPYSLVYALSLEEAEQVQSDKCPRLSDLIAAKVPVDTLPEKFEDSLFILPAGPYLIATIQNNQLRILPFYQSKIQVVPQNNRIDFSFKLYDQNNLEIKDATVTMGKKQIPYDLKMEVYHTHHVSGKKTMKIVIKNDLSYHEVNKMHEYYNTIQRITYSKWFKIPRYIYFRTRGFVLGPFRGKKYDYHSGYVATNQPEYRTGDTVKIKALVINRKGKYCNQTLPLTIENTYDDQIVLRKELQPVRSGNYQLEFVPGDSLRLDRQYRISFGYDQSRYGKLENSFQLKDYQLDETSYKVRLNKPGNTYSRTYKYPEEVALYLQGKDANGNYLLDATATVKITTSNINDYYPKNEFVKDSLFEYKLDLEPMEETKIVLPKTLFPDANVDYNVKVQFINSNHELHDTLLSFTYDGKRERLNLSLDQSNGSKVRATYFYEDTQQPVKAELIAYSDDYWNATVKYKKEITLPATFKAEPNIGKYRLTYNGIIEDLDMSTENSLIDYMGTRARDTVRFMIWNPRLLHVQYRIYKGTNNLIQQGIISDSAFSFSAFDPGKTVYYFSFNYTWANEFKENFMVSRQPENHDLKIVADIPERVQPGQKVKIAATVTDQKDRPVPNTDLTAFGVNAQFKSNNIPEVPYFGSYVSGRAQNPDYQIQTFEDYTRSYAVNPDWIYKFALDTTALYQMRFPGKQGYFLYDTLLHENDLYKESTQFSPYIVDSNGRLDVVSIIYLDGAPIYYNGSQSITNYSFVVEEGRHTLALRTPDALYTLDSIEMKRGCKLDFSFSKHLLPDFVTKVNKRSKLNKTETAQLQKYLIRVESHLQFYFAYIDQLKYKVQWNNVWPKRHKNGLYYTSTLGPARCCYLNFDPHGKMEELPIQAGKKYQIYSNHVAIVPDEDKKPKKIKLLSGYSDIGKTAFQDIKRLPDPVIKLQKRIQIILPQNPVCRDSMYGRYKYTLNSDSSWLALRFVNKNGHFLTINPSGVIRDLLPGTYQVEWMTKNFHQFVLDSVVIKPNTVTCQNLTLEDFRYVQRVDSPDFIRITTYQTEVYPIAGKLLSPEFISYTFQTGKGNYSLNGCIHGQVSEKETKESIPFASISVYQNDLLVQATNSDWEGHFTVNGLPSGRYDLKIRSVSYQDITIRGVLVYPGETCVLNPAMNLHSESLTEVVECLTKVNRFTDRYGLVSDDDVLKLKSYRNISNVVGLVSGTLSIPLIRGARSSGTVTYINGIKISSDSTFNSFSHLNLSENALYNFHSLSFSVGNIDDTVSESPNPYGTGSTNERIRVNFTDHAFWQPDLYTNRDGKVTFEVHYPDNITKWNVHFLGVNGKKQSGTASYRTVSMKNISANLATPRFLLEGDQSSVMTKVLNYTEKKQSVNTLFSINNHEISKDTLLDKSITGAQQIYASQAGDTLYPEFTVRSTVGFDGERRSIPVLPVGSIHTRGDFFYLDSDTSFTYSALNKEAPFTVYAEHDMLLELLKSVSYLEEYSYGCNEQNASRLQSLLMKKKIYSVLGKPFKEHNTIRKYIRKLEKSRKYNGSWGWWPTSEENLWMTVYVYKSLMDAKKDDFDVQNLSATEHFIQNQLHTSKNLRPELGMHTLLTLSGLGFDLNYHRLINDMKPTNDSTYYEMAKIKIYQNRGLKYDLNDVYKNLHQTALGGEYSGDLNYLGWYNNSNTVTALAYDILRNHKGSDSLKNAHIRNMRRFFLERKNQFHWNNTKETTEILNALLPELLEEETNSRLKKKSASLTINGNLVHTFPYQAQLPQNSSARIEYSEGEPIYLNFSQSYPDKNPAPQSDLFEITTTFQDSGGKIIPELATGKTVTLHVKVDCKKEANYIMLQVPIPAGCSYGSKTRLTRTSNESHREFYKDKTNIYIEKMEKGTHSYTIELQTRYAGIYTLNPAQLELMYFPQFFGRNQIRKEPIR